MEGKLPLGIEINGEIIKEFETTIMTGAVEEKMYERGNVKNMGKVVTALLKGCLTKLGELTKNQITPQLINRMSIIDRDYLMIQIRIESLGKDLQSKVVCPKCNFTVEHIQDLTDLETVFDEEGKLTLEIDLLDGVEDSGETYQKVWMRYPNGEDQIKLATLVDSNIAKANTAMINSCMFGIGEGKSKPPYNVANKLTSKDRHYLLEKLGRDESPGVNSNVEFVCEDCGFTDVIPLGAENFFTWSQTEKSY